MWIPFVVVDWIKLDLPDYVHSLTESRQFHRNHRGHENVMPNCFLPFEDGLSCEGAHFLIR